MDGWILIYKFRMVFQKAIGMSWRRVPAQQISSSAVDCIGERTNATRGASAPDLFLCHTRSAQRHRAGEALPSAGPVRSNEPRDDLRCRDLTSATHREIRAIT